MYNPDMINNSSSINSHLKIQASHKFYLVYVVDTELFHGLDHIYNSFESQKSIFEWQDNHQDIQTAKLEYLDSLYVFDTVYRTHFWTKLMSKK